MLVIPHPIHAGWKPSLPRRRAIGGWLITELNATVVTGCVEL